MQDPSLVIYNAVRVLDGTTIVTNGDQTDTIYDFLAAGNAVGGCAALPHVRAGRPEFHPPHFRRGLRTSTGAYRLSILKSD